MDDRKNPDIRSSQRDAWNLRYQGRSRQWGNARNWPSCIHKEGLILELGIGDGKNLRSRPDTSARFVGMDFSSEAIKACANDHEMSDVRLVIADACSIPFRDNTFSMIFAHHVIGHIPSGLQVCILDEIFRTLTPSGCVILTVFGTGDMREGSGTEIEPSTYLRGDGIITRYFSEDMIQKLCYRFVIRNMSRTEWAYRIRGVRYLRSEISVIMEKD